MLLSPWFATEEKFKKAYPVIVVVSVVLSFLFLSLVLLISGDTSLDVENYHSALKNACTLLGCTVGLVLVWVVDTMFVNFDTKAPWYAQVIKAALGFAIVLLIKSGLSSPLTALFGNEYVARIVRYFLIVAFAGAVWPLTFKWFSTLKIGFMERFSAWIAEKWSKLFKKTKAE